MLVYRGEFVFGENCIYFFTMTQSSLLLLLLSDFSLVFDAHLINCGRGWGGGRESIGDDNDDDDDDDEKKKETVLSMMG